MNLSILQKVQAERIYVYWDITEDDQAGQDIFHQAMENYQIMLNESDRITFMSDLKDQIIDDSEKKN